jgi:hypothetical protein
VTLPFLQKLEEKVGKSLSIKLNDNRSTILSVKWEPAKIKVSLHRLFLQAPQEVFEGLARYLRREEKKISIAVKKFINNNLEQQRPSKKIDSNKLSTKGVCYDLVEMYHSLNGEFFENRLQLFITWFGNPKSFNKTKITLGLYHDSLNLIKIHRLLDSSRFPKEVVRYVVYHEMLHHVCRPEVSLKTGRRKIHTLEFVEREKKYPQFLEIDQWLKNYYKNYFKGVC